MALPCPMSHLIRLSPSNIAGSLESGYSLNWGARTVLGKGGGEPLALL